MRVSVNPISSISVRINQKNQPVIASTSTFTGASDAQVQIDQAKATANAALAYANTALALAQNSYDVANTKLDLAGGTITGNLTVAGTIYGTIAMVDGGEFN
jgi:hypothetical protein